MRGRKPKERKSYVLRMGDGTIVEVTREVYLEWYQSKRRERYQDEKKRKHGVCSLETLGEPGLSSVNIKVKDSLEETAIRNLCIDKLRSVLDHLPEDDVYLLYLLYFEEITVKDAAQLFGCSRKTIQNRRKRILDELRRLLQGMGIRGGYF